MSTRAFSKFLTVFLALLQLVRSLGRRTKNPNPRRILVVHHLLLGDTLMLTPLLAKLRERFPRAEIAMTTPVGFVPLYRQRPYGVDAVPYDPRKPGTLIKLLKQSGFDLAFRWGQGGSWLFRVIGLRTRAGR